VGKRPIRTPFFSNANHGLAGLPTVVTNQNAAGTRLREALSSNIVIESARAFQIASRPVIFGARALPINPTWPSATLENENGLQRELGENEHAGAGELFSVVVVKAPTINLVRPAWTAPWNVAKARRTT
jgi:hypothetical protein